MSLNKRSFTLLELTIVILIISIMAGGMFAMMSSFGHRQTVDASVSSLAGDLRQTQQFAMAQRDGYQYYGLRFYDNLGPNSDRQGWKILCYCQEIGTGECVAAPALPINAATKFRVIKSSLLSDNSGKGPEFLEDTFFPPRARLEDSSDFQISPDVTQASVIIFIPEGAATKNGIDFLDSYTDEIKLSLDGYTKTIRIIPLTGHARIQ